MATRWATRGAGQPVGTAMKLANLANGFANNTPGHSRMSVDRLNIRRRPQQANPTIMDESGRFKSCYGSEGWGFESLRARHHLRRPGSCS